MDSVEQLLIGVTNCFLITDVPYIAKLSLLISLTLHRGKNRISLLLVSKFQPVAQVLSAEDKGRCGIILGKLATLRYWCNTAKSLVPKTEPTWFVLKPFHAAAKQRPHLLIPGLHISIAF